MRKNNFNRFTQIFMFVIISIILGGSQLFLSVFLNEQNNSYIYSFLFMLVYAPIYFVWIYYGGSYFLKL